uniref:SANT domain-containing protein n=1 Tax=Oryza punctata TaxID=4537 RepID=A0A0E0LZB4_ORYPU
MGKRCLPPFRRKKNSQQKRRMPPLYTAAARPPQECWSIRERVNFRIALGRFGQDWPRVAQFISTKSTGQICVYAEEYFLMRHTHSPVKKKGILMISSGC